MSRFELTTITSLTVRLRSAADGGNACAITSAAFADSGLPVTCWSEERPLSEVTASATDATTASPHAPSVRHGCEEHARASRSVTPVTLGCELIRLIG